MFEKIKQMFGINLNKKILDMLIKLSYYISNYELMYDVITM